MSANLFADLFVQKRWFGI